MRFDEPGYLVQIEESMLTTTKQIRCRMAMDMIVTRCRVTPRVLARNVNPLDMMVTLTATRCYS